MAVFGDLSSYEEAVRRIMLNGANGFLGFGYKMVSMILYFLVERRLIKRFPYPPPVDFHLQRVPTETEILFRTDGSERIAYGGEFEILEATLRDFYLRYIVDNNLDGNRFTDSLWILSRTSCKKNPGNKSYEPHGRQGRGTVIVPHIPNWDDPVDVGKFNISCRICPVRNLCTKNVPSKPRYVSGILQTRGPRLEPPEDRLTDFLF
jgi:hypothetical protein